MVHRPDGPYLWFIDPGVGAVDFDYQFPAEMESRSEVQSGPAFIYINKPYVAFNDHKTKLNLNINCSVCQVEPYI